MYSVIAQMIGLLGSAVMILSYQLKKPKSFILTQGLGGMLFALNFFMLGAYTGAILNGINILRSLLMTKVKKHRIFVPIFLIAVYIVATVFTYNGFISIAVLIAQSVGTISFYINNDKVMKLSSLFAVSPLWLVHNIITHSIGGVICEAVSIVSLIIYVIRTRGFKNV